jgi:hypothetical protein
MKNIYIIGAVVTLVYVLVLGGLTYYQVVPSLEERQSVQVVAAPVNSAPVSDDLAKELTGRQKYGDWPINISTDRLNKLNPFRL